MQALQGYRHPWLLPVGATSDLSRGIPVKSDLYSAISVEQQRRQQTNKKNSTLKRTGGKREMTKGDMRNLWRGKQKSDNKMTTTKKGKKNKRKKKDEGDRHYWSFTTTFLLCYFLLLFLLYNPTLNVSLACFIGLTDPPMVPVLQRWRGDTSCIANLLLRLALAAFSHRGGPADTFKERERERMACAVDGAIT